MAEGAEGVDGGFVGVGKTVILIRCKGVDKEPWSVGKFIQKCLDDTCIRSVGSGRLGDLSNMKRVHLCCNLIDEAFEELVDGICDWFAMIMNRVDEAKEIVGERAIGWFEGIEEEMRDLHVEADLFG